MVTMNSPRVREILEARAHGIPVPPMPGPPSPKVLDIFPDGAWRDHRCFIIGGGPSLKGFDFGRLRGEKVIAINKAFFDVPWADIMFSIDRAFLDLIISGKFGENYRQAFESFGGVKLWLDIFKSSYPPGIYFVPSAGKIGWTRSLREGLFHGQNSGYGALNLALVLGANPIYLLGYDCSRGPGGETHYHDGYPCGLKPEDLNTFRSDFEAGMPLLPRDRRIVNLNPDSALRCFEFGRLEDIRFALPADYRRVSVPLVPLPPAVPRKPEPPVLFSGPLGFGDNINLRIVIRHLARRHEIIYLSTTIPEAFWDFPNVRFVRPDPGHLRTQAKHLASFPPDFFSEIPKETPRMGWGLGYTPQKWPRLSDGNVKQADFPGEEITVSECIRRRAGIPREEFDFTFPVRQKWIEAARSFVSGLDLKGKKLCLVRPNTLRPEWLCPTRNPKTEHYQTLIDLYRDEYFFLSVADLEDGKEWLDGEILGIDAILHRGEVPWSTLFGLIKISDMFITNPGWGMLAGIATRAKTFTIFGGELHPRYFVDEHVGTQNFGYVAPDPFCNCFKMEHACNKKIPRSRLIAAFEELRTRPKWEKQITVGLAPGLGDVHWPLLKMESFKEKNAVDRLRISISNEHDYPLEFARHVPFVDEVQRSKPRFPFRMSLAGGDGRPLDAGANGADCIMEFGSRLEAGMSLERILPEYETNWGYEIKGLDEYSAFIADLRKKTGGRLVLFYPSSVGSNKNWARGQWTPESWIALARLIKAKNGCPPVLVGAEFDRDYADVLTSNSNGPLFINLVGQMPIMKTLAIVRGADLMLGFSAGIAIMATHFRVPCAIFWPIRGVSEYPLYNPLFMRSWIPPWAEDNYFGFAYGDPKTTPRGVFETVEKFL